MRLSAIILASLAIAGCDGRPATHGDLRSEESDRIDADARLETQIDALRSEVADLRRDLEYAEQDIDRASRVADAVADQAAHNAKVANENAVKQMTAEGRCGTRLVQVSPGVIRNEKIPCTVADLRR